MSDLIRIKEFKNFLPPDLNMEEMIFTHLNLSEVYIKDRVLISTLTVVWNNINSAMHNDHTKALMPILSMLAILDQLGTCYNRKDMLEPRFQRNGIKRCLYYFGEFDEDDKIHNTLFSLRNGLLHNVSLTSYDRHNDSHYYFAYDKSIENVYEDAQSDWDGNYDNLDGNGTKFITKISVENLKDLVYTCIKKASDLNNLSKLTLRLQGGIKQLYFDYMRYSKYKDFMNK